MKIEKVYENLCYYDMRNPQGIKELIDLDIEENEGYGDFPKKDCSCDNCFYYRTGLAEEIIKLMVKVEGVKNV